MKLFIILLTLIACQNSTDMHTKTHKTGNTIVPVDYVAIPDDTTAIKIGEIYLNHRFGTQNIVENHPLKAAIINDSVWKVTGTLPPNFFGGVPEIHLAKKDGKVLKITHGK